MNEVDHTSLEGVKVLVVDDEEILAWSIESELKKRGAEPIVALSGAAAHEAFLTSVPDLAICDIRLPDISGLDLLKKFHSKIPTLPVILMTAHGGIDSAVSAVRLSAFDYLQKPFNMSDLMAAVRRASEVSQLRQKVSLFEGLTKGQDPVQIIGSSMQTKTLVSHLQKIARSGTDTVLIYGETGSGKELAARALHEWSSHQDKPYIEINCASIPETLLESELFGYEKGAFTDARSRKFGLFEMAKDGTIFLDEIGELPMKLQSKLLRALEYRRFKRLGGVKDITFAARIVAATNRNLLAEVSKGNFRSDLYYRLNVIPVDVPSLRERREDIPQLAEFFLDLLSRQLGCVRPNLTQDAIQHLTNYDWPGNIRELKNVLHRALVLESGLVLHASQLRLEKFVCTPLHTDVNEPMATPQFAHKTKAVSSGDQMLFPTGFNLPPTGVSLEDLEKHLLTQALDLAQQNQSKAAELLHISRHTLRYRLEKHGMMKRV